MAISKKLLDDVNRQLFGLATKQLHSMGGVPMAVYGIEHTGDRMSGVVEYPIRKKEDVPKALRMLSKDFGLVVTIAEVWKTTTLADGPYASQSPSRTEAVSISIYVGNQVYHAAHPITRNPTGLTFEALSETEHVSGQVSMSFAQPMTPARRQKVLTALHQAMDRPESDDSFALIHSLLLDFIGHNTNLEPLCEALFKWPAPQLAGQAIDMMDYMLTTTPVGSDPSARRWLAGLHVEPGRYLGAKPTPPSLAELLAVFKEEFEKRRPSSAKWQLGPPDAICLNPTPSRGALAAVQSHSSSWIDPDASLDEDLQAHLQFVSPLNNRFAAGPSLIYFAAVEDLAEPGPPWAIAANDSRECPPEVRTALSEAAEETSRRLEIELDLHEVGTAGLALLDKAALSEGRTAAAIINGVRDRIGNTRPLSAEITPVAVARPANAILMISIWDAQGQFQAPLAFQARRQQFHLPESWCELATTTYLNALGISDIKVHPLVQVDELPGEQLGAFMPDGTGGWFNTVDMVLPEARGLLQEASWQYPDEETFMDAKVQLLPYPHRLSRAGLTEIFQRHYTPLAYKVLKAVFGDLTIPTSQVWTQVCARLPQFEAFMTAAPTISQPSSLELKSARLTWGKAPTLITTNGLSQRLALTDIDFRLPTQFVRLPYSFAYLHFDSPPVESEFEDEESRYTAVLEGVFLEEEKGLDSRTLIIQPVWRNKEDRGHYVTNELSFHIRDDMATFEAVWARFCSSADDPEESYSTEATVLQETLKVLVYLNLSDARLEPRTPRSKALQSAAQKKPESRLKEIKRAASLCDYIEVGPISTDSQLPELTGLNKRGMPVHFRRGHIRAVRCGKNWSSFTMKFIEPVLVNKHLLADGEVTAPKDYKIG